MSVLVSTTTVLPEAPVSVRLVSDGVAVYAGSVPVPAEASTDPVATAATLLSAVVVLAASRSPMAYDAKPVPPLVAGKGVVRTRAPNVAVSVALTYVKPASAPKTPLSLKITCVFEPGDGTLAPETQPKLLVERVYVRPCVGQLLSGR